MAWERSGVPGGQTRTSWYGRDVPAMWRVLENQQSDDHWRLVAGWRKASELTATHLSRLEQYRANLVDAWPPDRNAAAAAYVSRLDFLIQNVRATHDVAAANYSTLSATVGALASAQRELKPLYEEYVTKARAMKEHADLSAFNAAAEGPTLLGAAPATPTDLERLNNRARAIMYTLSHTLIEAEAAIRQPPAYQPTVHWDQGVTDAYGNSGRLTQSPRTPTRSPALETSGGAQRESSVTTTTGIVARVTRGASRRIDSERTQHSFGGEGARRRTFELGPTTVGSRTPAVRSTSPPAMSGGVIGAKPELEHQAPSRAPVRINPVGGVIGGARFSENVTNPSNGISHLIGGAPTGGRDRNTRRNIEPLKDTVWETPGGVPPVIEPRATTPYEPGPAIGLDR